MRRQTDWQLTEGRLLSKGKMLGYYKRRKKAMVVKKNDEDEEYDIEKRGKVF